MDDGRGPTGGPDEAADPDPIPRQERLAYLAGLAEGIERTGDPATGGLLGGIVAVLDELSREIGDVRRAQRSLAEDMDELADELGVEPSDVVVECPACGREVAFATRLLDEDELELTCPNCGEVVYTPGEDELVDRPASGAAGAEPGAVAGDGGAGPEAQAAAPGAAARGGAL